MGSGTTRCQGHKVGTSLVSSRTEGRVVWLTHGEQSTVPDVVSSVDEVAMKRSSDFTGSDIARFKKRSDFKVTVWSVAFKSYFRSLTGFLRQSQSLLEFSVFCSLRQVHHLCIFLCQ